MNVQVAQTLYQAIDKSLSSTITTGTSNVMMGVGVLFGIFWLIYLNMKSIHWLFQGLDVAIEDLVLTIFKASFIIYFAFNVSWYISTVVPVVNDLPLWMAKQLSTSGGEQSNQVDELISVFINAVQDTAQAMQFNPFTTTVDVIALGLLGFIFLLIGGIPFLLVCVGTLITLKAATTIILVVGPIFIAFALFPITRQYFWGWVSVIGGFMLTQVLFSVVLTLEMNFINNNIVKGNSVDTDLLSCLAILLYFGAFTVLATEIPNYAASIMGGSPAGGVTGVGGILGRSLGTTAATRMSKAMGKKLMNLRNRNRIS